MKEERDLGEKKDLGENPLIQWKSRPATLSLTPVSTYIYKYNTTWKTSTSQQWSGLSLGDSVVVFNPTSELEWSKNRGCCAFLTLWGTHKNGKAEGIFDSSSLSPLYSLNFQTLWILPAKSLTSRTPFILFLLLLRSVPFPDCWQNTISPTPQYPPLFSILSSPCWVRSNIYSYSRSYMTAAVFLQIWQYLIYK